MARWISARKKPSVTAHVRAQTAEDCGVGDIHEAASDFLASPFVAMEDVRLDMASRAWVGVLLVVVVVVAWIEERSGRVF